MFLFGLSFVEVLSAFLLLQSSRCGRELPCADSEEGGGGVQGSGPPLENHKNIGFLSNTGSPSYQASIQCWAINHRPTSETPLFGVSLAGRRWPAF